MTDNQGTKDEDKYLNLPVLTPEEELAIEEREKRIAALRAEKEIQPAEISSAAAAVLGGTLGPEDKQAPASAEAQAADDTGSMMTEVFSPEELQERLSQLDDETLSSVLSATDLFKTCILPSNTELQERNLKTKNDILIGDHCKIEFGLYGADIAVCECTELYGDIVATGDLRIDNFCEVFGTVICNGDAFIGEGVKIHGKMNIGGNLDIAENAQVEKEFQTFGTISIRNPIPVIMYLLIYIFAMLHLNGEKATEKKLNEFMAEVKSTPLVLPPETTMNLAYFTTPTAMDIGANCRVHGNIRAQSVKIKRDTTLFGSVSVSQKAKIGVRDAIHGDVAGKDIRVDRGADILGDLIGETVWLHEDAHVSGIIRATEGLSIGSGD